MTTTQNTAADTRLPVWARLAGGMQDALPAGTTVQDALRLRGLADWQVETMPLVTMAHDGSPLRTEKVATVRRTHDGGSKVLGVGLGEDYPVIQNEVALGMDTLVSESGAEVFTAGAWKNDRQVFLSMRLPEGVTVGGVDRTDLYLNAMTSHDGSMALTLMVTPVRLYCTNAIPLALRSAEGAYKVRHVGDAGLKVAEARAALDLTFAYADEWAQAMEVLMAESMSVREFNGMVEEEFLPLAEGVEGAKRDNVLNARSDLSALFVADAKANTGQNRYTAFNALTEWSEWVRPRNPQTEAAAASTLLGAGATFRQRAYRTLAMA